MAYKHIVHLHADIIPKCPHCGSDLSELEAYICLVDFKPGDCVTQDSDGYCRDWKEKKHTLKTCRECKRLLVIGREELNLYVVACRSETDIRYLEMMGK